MTGVCVYENVCAPVWRCPSVYLGIVCMCIYLCAWTVFVSLYCMKREFVRVNKAMTVCVLVWSVCITLPLSVPP